MSKPERKKQLKIDPKNEIVFKGPFDQVVTEYFILKNPTESIIAFKVKTTAPKRYCVRPNNGLVQPQKTVQVAVMLQPGDLSQEKNKHKFMIQSVIVPNNDNNQANIDELFKSASPTEIMDSKFKCVFIDNGGNVLEPSTTAIKASEQFINTNNAQKYNNNDDQSDLNDELLSNGATSSAGDGLNDQQQTGIGHQEPHSSTTNTAAGNYSTAITYNDNDDDDDAIGSTATTNNNALFQTDDCGSTTANTTTKHNNTINTNNDKVLESKLKLAQDEIKKLKDKLQEVQRYASKLAESDKMNVSSSSSSNIHKINSTTQQNDSLSNNQLLKLSAIVMLISFFIGLFFGKTVF